jgi:nucleotide-binding universal stress UspA family protein
MGDQLHGPVVVGIDGSDDAVRAALYGAWEADRRRATLRLVCAHQLVPPWGRAVAIADDAWQHGWLRDVLTKAHAAVEEAFPDVPVDTQAIAGTSAAVLVSESASASLVVLATHARDGVVGRLSGSVTAQVAAHAAAPVIALRPSGDFTADPANFLGRPIVVGMDGSDESQKALAFAVDEAVAREAAVQAVYVWDLFEVHAIEPLVEKDYALADAAEKAERLIGEATSGWADRYPDLQISSIAVHSLDPVAALRDVGSRAGLLVVGSRGHGGFLGLRLGSTVDGLIRTALTPVAVVRGDYPGRR